jgi:hypothetical protein
MIQVKHGWFIKGGQKYFTAHNEKSSRDKNCETQERKTVQVGHTNDRKEEAPTRCGTASAWFLDTTFEIPPNQSWFG